MRLLLLYIFFLSATSNALGMVFINHPAAKDGDEVWFRSNFSLEEVPDSADLTLTTSGYVLAYINGRIAFPEIIWPYRPPARVIERGDSLPLLRQYTLGMATRTIDVKPLLRKGNNVVALWFAPCVNIQALNEKEKWDITPDSLRLPLSSFRNIQHQLSPSLTVTDNGKKKDIVTPKSSWLCHIASSKITVSGEDVCATEYIEDWKNADFNFNSTWIAAEQSWTEMMNWNALKGEGLCQGKIIEAKKNLCTATQQHYYLPYETSGLLRITMRGTKKNQELDINGMKYRCLGIEDEQMITRFATVTTDSVTITNKTNRPFPDIQRVEIIEITYIP